MTKSFKALVAGLCSLAVLATGCTDKPAPEVPSAEAAVVSAEATTATIKLTTKLISEYAYVVRTDATYIPASIHNEAMLSGAWTSIAQ